MPKSRNRKNHKKKVAARKVRLEDSTKTNDEDKWKNFKRTV